MTDRFTESVVEDASLGWTVKHGPEIAPGELAADLEKGQVAR